MLSNELHIDVAGALNVPGDRLRHLITDRDPRSLYINLLEVLEVRFERLLCPIQKFTFERDHLKMDAHLIYFFVNFLPLQSAFAT